MLGLHVPIRSLPPERRQSLAIISSVNSSPNGLVKVQVLLDLSTVPGIRAVSMAWVYNTADSNAPTDAGEIIAVSVVMTALALLVVALRVYVRWGILNVFGVGMQQASKAQKPNSPSISNASHSPARCQQSSGVPTDN